ncbi:type I restriction endonuclease subunit R [Acidithiobacillus sp. CV18-2]|nr:type I restriction endonuclease subunit R [Acidithiobacillus sp. CV18-3]MBU2756906.1 type I restriction endonuclease subunit R [Acidithiobacillus sp. BN09-2]MBU2777996.1 type I restriction endonuclease subunit R [Acidithiobacillus sp. CV18-2]MBU2799617.1 type I restriction endonuclease subunit R [Acidithiobacillus sp. VAN18-4]
MHKSLNESAIESHAIRLFQSLGYDYRFGPDIGPEGNHPERKTYSDVLLEERLWNAVDRMNPGIPRLFKEDAIARVRRLASSAVLSSNHAFHRLFTEGVPIEYQDGGETRGVLVRLADFDHPAHNDFLVVNQFTVTQDRVNRRADMVVFVNGIPLGLIELKNMADANATAQKAYNQLQTYQADIPQLLTYNAVLAISDGQFARLGCLGADYQRFAPWKTVDGVELIQPDDDPLEFLIKGVFDPQRFLDLVRHFIVFEDDGRKTTKKIAAYHQYHAVRKALGTAIAAAGVHGDRKGGVVWHTQGSGKSLTMLFFAGKLIQLPDLENPTLLVITDRNDLDGQLFGTFARGKELLRQDPVQAESRADLRELLKRASGGVIFSTIQKFAPDNKLDTHPLLSERRNIIVLADEAHRSQYELVTGFAAHMRVALPNATFVAFTGTPLELEDRDTRNIFGDYIDIYDIQRAVEDGATVPIYYDSRLVKLDLPEDQRDLVDAGFEEITEDEEADIKEQMKTRWAQLEALVGAPRRIQQVAEDLLQHWEERKKTQPFPGKAMIVCMSRRIAVELYNAIIRLRPEWHSEDDSQGRIKVIMTGSASDPLSYKPHIRTKAAQKDIGDRFKDPDDPLEMVIVRDMWLTGFDAPPLDTLYVDRPMRGHGLMQAIARVNRVFREKPGGLVVDYIGIAQDLKNAIQTYTRSGGKGDPVETQEAAVRVLLEKLDICRGIFHDFEYGDFLTGDAEDKRVTLLKAAEFLVVGDLKEEGLRRRFLQASAGLKKAASLSGGDARLKNLMSEIMFFVSVSGVLRKSQEGEALLEDKEYAIRQLVDRSIAPEGVIDLYALAGLPKPDISLLSDEFLEKVQNVPEKNLALEMLRKLLQDKVRLQGKTNIMQSKAFSEKLEEALRKYHNRSANTVEVMEQLIAIAKEMQAQGARNKALGLSEEEAAFYDVLGSNDSAVQAMGDDILKEIAREVADTVRRNTTIDWAIREQARAHLRRMVKRVLRKNGYPPDKQEGAVELVIEQAEGLGSVTGAQ